MNLVEFANSVEIVIPEMTKKELIRAACLHYNTYNKNIGRTASPKDPDEFIFRITVNFLRHELTTYEEELRRMQGFSEEKAAHDILKSRILDAIAKAYPWIRKECAMQKNQLSFKVA